MNKVLVVYEDACIGLAVIRGLGAEGVPVAGIVFRGGGVGARSKYLKEKITLDTHADLTAGKLREAIELFKPKYIMAVGERDMVHLNGLRAGLPAGVRMLFPDQPVLQQALSKPVTLRIAGRLGIDCPRTFDPAVDDDLAGFLATTRCPVVMKLPYSKPREVPESLWMKHQYARTPEEVREVLDLYSRFGLFPIIQEYVRGRGVGVELCLYRGEVVGAFQHERLHELPLGGGASTYCRGVALDPDLLDRSVTLLREMRWEGVAMVEFRRDPETGRVALMEVNGRFWGSLFLAAASGVNFPSILYRTVGEGETIRPPAFRIGLRGKREGRELSWMVDAVILRRELPPEGFPSRLRCLREFIKTCGFRVKRDIWSWSDPMPGLCFRLGLLPLLLSGFAKWVCTRLRPRSA